MEIKKVTVVLQKVHNFLVWEYCYSGDWGHSKTDLFLWFPVGTRLISMGAGGCLLLTVPTATSPCRLQQ